MRTENNTIEANGPNLKLTSYFHAVFDVQPRSQGFSENSEEKVKVRVIVKQRKSSGNELVQIQQINVRIKESLSLL